MMNAQLPSGLQALLQASQVLQQQASPTAPGPQGPQPTVANQVAQQVQQAVEPQGMMPGMRDMGMQAGIAGQIMAQRQAQQQQMAQNPQAVAQMAAQMLQRGVGALPVDMQFKEGGVIGFDGEEESFVAGPILEGYAAEGIDFSRRMRPRPESNVEFVEIDGELVPRSAAERIYAERARALREATEQRAAGLQAARDQMLREAELRRSAEPMAAGASRLEDYYRPYPSRGPMTSTISGLPSLVSEKEIGTQNLTGPVARLTADQPPAEARLPASTPSGGIATLAPQPAPTVPQAEMPTRKDVAGLMQQFTTDPDIQKAFEAVQKQDAEILARKKAQPAFEEQGIAALQRAEQERVRQLQESRGRDDWTRLRAFFRDLSTRGNHYDAVQAGMDARDAGAAKAALAHEQAVIELRKAKEAREMGNMELERNHKAAAFQFLKDERSVKADMAKLEGNLQAEYDKMTAAERTAFANRQSATQLEMSRQAQQALIETMRLKTQAETNRDTKQAAALSSIISRITQGYEEIRKIEKDYPMLNNLSPEEIAKNPTFANQAKTRNERIADIQDNVIAPAIADRERITTALLGGGTQSADPRIVIINGKQYRFPTEEAANEYRKRTGQ